MTNNNDIDSDLLLPEIWQGRRKVGHPSREDDYEDINRLLPTAEYIDSLNPVKQAKLRLAAQVFSLCWSMAGELIETQDESILDDYNW